MGARIGHIAIFSENPSNLAKFYGEVFGIKVTGVDDLGNAWVTDGYMDIALLPRRHELAPQGVHHFGITVDADEKPGVYERLKERGHMPMKPPPGRPYVEDAVKDADGNKFDISTSAVRVRGATVEMKDEAKEKDLVKA